MGRIGDGMWITSLTDGDHNPTRRKAGAAEEGWVANLSHTIMRNSFLRYVTRIYHVAQGLHF